MFKQHAFKLLSASLFFAFWPISGFAEPSQALVIGLQGQATITRANPPRSIPLKFRDGISLQDRVETGEGSALKVLVGGKALVTVRELSSFIVAQESGRSVIDLQSGAIAVQVAESLLGPGEAVQIRTPNAIAQLGGGLIVAEVRAIRGVLETVFTAAQVTQPALVSLKADAASVVRLAGNETVSIAGAGPVRVASMGFVLIPTAGKEATLGAVQGAPAEWAVEAVKGATDLRAKHRITPPEALVNHLIRENVEEARKLVDVILRSEIGPVNQRSPDADNSSKQSETEQSDVRRHLMREQLLKSMREHSQRLDAKSDLKSANLAKSSDLTSSPTLTPAPTLAPAPTVAPSRTVAPSSTLTKATLKELVKSAVQSGAVTCRICLPKENGTNGNGTTNGSGTTIKK